MQRVLSAHREAGQVANPRKCFAGQREVQYLGTFGDNSKRSALLHFEVGPLTHDVTKYCFVLCPEVPIQEMVIKCTNNKMFTISKDSK